MPIYDLKEQIARLPEQPGVYLWRNAAGETIYVGKARALRDRVRSYMGAAGVSPRHDALLDEITAVEVIVTDMVVHPKTKNAYIAVMRGQGTESKPALLRVDGAEHASARGVAGATSRIGSPTERVCQSTAQTRPSGSHTLVPSSVGPQRTVPVRWRDEPGGSSAHSVAGSKGPNSSARAQNVP